MRRKIIIVSLLSLLFCGCGKNNDGVPLAQSSIVTKAAQGWILVKNGSPELVRKAVEEHADFFGKVRPKEFRVALKSHPSGFLAVTFPDGIPPYNLVNLIGWLDQPVDIDQVSGAVGWITSPSSGVRYSLQPDTDNEWGDTLIGAPVKGKSVQVYLPEAGLCELTRHIGYLPEPDLSSIREESGTTFTIKLDVDHSFGNPEFKVTNKKDSNWKR